MRRRLFILVVLINAICGCSNEQVYTAVQKNRQLQCEKLPPSEYERCMQEHDQSYDDYSQEREDTLKDDQ